MKIQLPTAVFLLIAAWNNGLGPFQAVARGQAPASAPPAILSITVVDGATGRPLSAANVRLFPGKEAPNTYGVVGHFSSQALPFTTDSNGRVEARVPSGDYGIRANRMGYRDLAYLGEHGFGAHFPLKAGERRELTFRLWKDSSLEGRIIDDGHDPLPDIEVSALRRIFNGGRALYRLEARAETNDQGHYRFPRLVPGDYIVGVAAGSGTWPADLTQELQEADQDKLLVALATLGQSGAPPPPAAGVRIRGQVFDWFGPEGKIKVDGRDSGGPSVYRSHFYPNATRLDSAVTVHVGLGQAVMNIDVALTPPVTTQSIAGRLSGPEGRTSGVAISLIPAELQGLESVRGFEIATAVTGKDGRFVMLGVPSGNYILQSVNGSRAWAPKAGTTAALLQATPVSGTVWRAPNRSDENILTARTDVTVADEPLVDVLLGLKPAHRVEGRIVLPTTGESPETRQVVNTGIYLEPVDGTHEGAFVNVHADATGHFVTPDYPPGRYRIIVDDIRPSWRIAQILVNGEDVIDGLFELGDQDITGVTVTLTDKRASLQGTLSGAAAETPYARIVVFPADIERWVLRGMHPWWYAQYIRANEAREFRVPQLRPGRFLVAAIADDTPIEITNPDWVREIAKSATPVELKWDTTASVTLKTLVSIKR